MLYVLCSEKDRYADRTWTATLMENGFQACTTIKIHAYVLCSEKDRCAVRTWTATLMENGFQACKTIKIHALCSMLRERPMRSNT